MKKIATLLRRVVIGEENLLKIANEVVEFRKPF